MECRWGVAGDCDRATCVAVAHVYAPAEHWQERQRSGRNRSVSSGMGADTYFGALGIGLVASRDGFACRWDQCRWSCRAGGKPKSWRPYRHPRRVAPDFSRDRLCCDVGLCRYDSRGIQFRWDRQLGPTPDSSHGSSGIRTGSHAWRDRSEYPRCRDHISARRLFSGGRYNLDDRQYALDGADNRCLAFSGCRRSQRQEEIRRMVMSDDKNDKKGSSFRGAAMKVVGVVVAVIVILLGLSFGGDGGGGLVYVDEARGEQCQLFRGAGVLSAEDENAVRSGSEGISAKEADASADVVEVSGLPSGDGSPVYIVRQFGESDVVIKSGVCFFSLSEAAVNAIDNPAELKTSTEEASPEGGPVGGIPAGG